MSPMRSGPRATAGHVSPGYGASTRPGFGLPYQGAVAVPTAQERAEFERVRPTASGRTSGAEAAHLARKSAEKAQVVQKEVQDYVDKQKLEAREREEKEAARKEAARKEAQAKMISLRTAEMAALATTGLRSPGTETDGETTPEANRGGGRFGKFRAAGRAALA